MTAFCTVIARNYFAQALTLIESVRKCGHLEPFFLLVIDCDVTNIESHDNSDYNIIICDHLNIEKLLKRRFKYNITEFSTSVKPKLISNIFARGFSKVIYLDPDIYVFKHLIDITHRLDSCDVLLTPHMDSPPPADWRGVDHFSMMLTGIYNLGFLAIKNTHNSLQILDWWDAQLENKCVDEQDKGIFTDQKYFDVATTLFSGISVLKEPGYNSAPWNLHSRFIRKVNNHWLCNTDPLYFYHFSNYKLSRSELLAGYMSGMHLNKMPNIKLLYDEYRSSLLKNNYSFYSKQPYKYNNFKCGVKIDNITRKIYRDKKYLYETIADPFDSLYLAAMQEKIMNGTLKSILFRIKHRLLKYFL